MDGESDRTVKSDTNVNCTENPGTNILIFNKNALSHVMFVSDWIVPSDLLSIGL